jgi:hypothetical protein
MRAPINGGNGAKDHFSVSKYQVGECRLVTLRQ